MRRLVIAASIVTALGAVTACGGGDDWECFTAEGDDPDFLAQVGCKGDFDTLSSEPLNASIPGAVSVKTVIDRLDENTLYFTNSKRYPVHYDFASTHLSGNGLPIVPLLSMFNTTEYFSPNRRFLLGAVTYYEGPDVWAYEIAPYDTSSAEMIEQAYSLLVDNAFFGDDLYFHPTSDAVEAVAETLPTTVKVITTDELFANIDYQPLNLGTSMGQLRFRTAAQLETEYVGFRDIVVLDAVPNDISVVSGIITGTFQTPLSHINVLSQNRGTPNMGLRDAYDNADLRALEGKWVKLVVGAFDYEVVEVTQEEADAWWEDNRPDPLGVPGLDLTQTELLDMELMLDLANLSLDEALDYRIPAYGGKATHYGAFEHMDADTVPHPKAFAVPVYYYMQHLEANGLNDMIDTMLADPDFQTDPGVRDLKLGELRDAIIAAPLDPTFYAALLAKLDAEYNGIRMRFRSSTNAEDLDGFTGAGLYTSRSGDPNDPLYPVDVAIKTVWASVWRFRAFDEREYRSIDHTAVGMALLVHNSFPCEEANGVAVTANIFDPQGIEPGFYINSQLGDVSVVLPPANVTSDQLIYHYDLTGQPIVYLAHSNLVADGQSVLTRAQVQELGTALKEIHQFFNDQYGPWTPDHFYAMDIEFKFDDLVECNSADPRLFIKQARPYPGRGN